jgi:biopolymer transport protein ExbD
VDLLLVLMAFFALTSAWIEVRTFDVLSPPSVYGTVCSPWSPQEMRAHLNAEALRLYPDDRGAFVVPIREAAGLDRHRIAAGLRHHTGRFPGWWELALHTDDGVEVEHIVAVLDAAEHAGIHNVQLKATSPER